MKKVNLKIEGLGATLSREQMKQITGGLTYGNKWDCYLASGTKCNTVCVKTDADQWDLRSACEAGGMCSDGATEYKYVSSCTY